MTIDQVKDAQINNAPLFWERKTGDWRKVLIDEVVEEVDWWYSSSKGKSKLDKPMIFVKVLYKGHRICVDEAHLDELHYEKP
jgi:hypothetical protein